MKSYKIILASSSPRRAELIKKIKAEVEIFPSFFDEDKIKFKGDAADYAAKLSKEKASEVFNRIIKGNKEGNNQYESHIVLGADTVVALDNRIFNKPNSEKQALEFFKTLSGRTHEVITGVCLIDNRKIIKDFEKSYVTFNAFNDKIVYNYIKSLKPFDKAGGYGLQDIEIKSLIGAVRGDKDNIIGLPVRLIKKLIKENF